MHPTQTLRARQLAHNSGDSPINGFLALRSSRRSRCAVECSKLCFCDGYVLGNCPATVTARGGVWKLGSPDGYHYWGRSLAEAGYALCSANYGSRAIPSSFRWTE